MSAIQASAFDIELPAPVTTGGDPVLDVIAARRSTRRFDTDRRLTPQQISSLLWAAAGTSHDGGKLTTPTAMDRREISLYVITADGAWLWNRDTNRLTEISGLDIRRDAGMQDFVYTAPLNIAIVSDRNLQPNDIMAGVDAGAVMQNIYLWCAANSLATVARGSFNADRLHESLRLEPGRQVMIVQTIGYPAAP